VSAGTENTPTYGWSVPNKLNKARNSYVLLKNSNHQLKPGGFLLIKIRDDKMKMIFLLPIMIMGIGSAANSAKVCVTVQSGCYSSPVYRSGSGQYCWCGVGGVWTWAGDDFNTTRAADCSSNCPSMCGV
jgi:hypothetical protein